MDTVQLVLLFIIVVLAVLLLVLGIQVYVILLDLRTTIKKANRVLDDVELISETVSAPLASLSTILTGAKAGAFFAQMLRGKDTHHNHNHHHDHE